VSVDVRVIDVTDLYAYQFDVIFNPTILSAAPVTEGSFLAGGGGTLFIPGDIDNAAGTITLIANTLLGPVPGVNGSGSLTTLRFTGVGLGSSGVTISNALLLDSVGGDIATDIQNGSISVVIPEPATGLLAALALLALVCNQTLSRRR
jgi:general secretion pathway protein D